MDDVGDPDDFKGWAIYMYEADFLFSLIESSGESLFTQ